MRDFLCQFCPQRFGRKDHLVRHIKKSHHAQYRPPEETGTTATVKKEITETTKGEIAPEIEIKTEIPEGSIPTVYNPDFGTLEFLGDEFLLEQGDPSLLLPSTSEQGLFYISINTSPNSLFPGQSRIYHQHFWFSSLVECSWIFPKELPLIVGEVSRVIHFLSMTRFKNGRSILLSLPQFLL